MVNKLDAIGHKYRTFELDLLAGEGNYKTEVHEEKLRYQLDFSQVIYLTLFFLFNEFDFVLLVVFPKNTL